MSEESVQAVPFFLVTDIQASMRFYVEGLGFRMTNQWVPDGKLRWCWLELGGAAVMLQEFAANDPRLRQASESIGLGVAIYFICQDAVAMWREFVARGVTAARPFVGNNMWVTGTKDPDGYQLYFESPTDVPEDTVFGEEP